MGVSGLLEHKRGPERLVLFGRSLLDFEGLVGLQQEVTGHKEGEGGTQCRQQELHEKGRGGWTVRSIWTAV